LYSGAGIRETTRTPAFFSSYVWFFHHHAAGMRF
jgi:hypothetical protein